MGRKNRSKKSNNQSKGAANCTEEKQQLSKAAKRDVMDLVRVLLEKCSIPPTSSGKEFEEYLEIRETVEQIREIQKDLTYKSDERADKFSVFMDWLKSRSVDTSCVGINKFDGFGYGLQASKDLKEEEWFLRIPRDVMMTSDSAQKSVLGPLINADKILQVMPSVVLALHLLCERRSEQSPWKPYLDILPDTYNTPLYFTPDDVKLLKGSPAQSDCMNQFRNIARQYGYFYKLFQSDPAIAASLPIKDVFTYDDYRWAVSTVMTRQNQIPTPDGNKMTFALIPLWDMCNHCSGIITTSFNLEQNCSECYALRDYTQGDQIFIFYGARSNAELLVNNGFVYMENEHDRTAVRLGIGKADPLLDLKSKLLARCGLEPSRTFYLHTGEYSVDSNLLIFLRVFQMDEDTLKSKCSQENVEEVKAELGDLNKVVSIETESKVWSFLETRTGLLLRGYETSLEDDEVLLKSDRLSGCQRLCVQLRCLEKRIFKSSLEFASRQKQKLAPSSGT